MKRYPATFSILGLSLALQVLFTVYPETTVWFCFNPATLNGWLGIVAYQFSHASWSHLLNNFTFGLPFMFYLEGKLGHNKFLEFYVGCGVMAALFHTALIGPGFMIGSSGSLFGVMTGACLAFGKTRATHGLALSYCTLMILEQLVQATNPMMFGIAFYGHVGGAVGAFLLSSWLYNTRKPHACKHPHLPRV